MTDNEKKSDAMYVGNENNGKIISIGCWLSGLTFVILFILIVVVLILIRVYLP